jgi:molybdate transport system ATP-binding protein
VAEVARLATTVVLLADGRVTEVGRVQDVLAHADDADRGGVVDAAVQSHDDTFKLTTLVSVAGELQVPRLAAEPGTKVRAHIRARDVMLSLQPPQDISALNVLAGRVIRVEPVGTGAQSDVALDCGGAHLSARLTTKSVQRLQLNPGSNVYAVIKSVSFDRR